MARLPSPSSSYVIQADLRLLCVKISYLALDIVTKRFFGQEMGFIKHEDKNGMLADTRANGPAIHALARLPRLKMFLLRSFGKFLVPTAGDGSGLGNVLQVQLNFQEWLK